MVRRGLVLAVVAALLAVLVPSAAVAAVGSRVDDYDRDGVSDLLTVGDDGCLTRWSGTGGGGVGSAARQGCGWENYLSAAGGDLNGDGNGDIVALNAAQQPRCLWRWYGDGQGGFGLGAQVGCGWENFAWVRGAGDITGDGNEDLVGLDLTKTDPCLWRWSGNGQGGFEPAVVIRCDDAWHQYRDVTAAGDINRDGRPDLVAVGPRDCLFRWYGNGRGGYSAGGAMDCDNAGYVDLTGMTDLNEDGNGDLLARVADGNGGYHLASRLSTGFGSYTAWRDLGPGWDAADLV